MKASASSQLKEALDNNAGFGGPGECCQELRTALTERVGGCAQRGTDVTSNVGLADETVISTRQ